MTESIIVKIMAISFAMLALATSVFIFKNSNAPEGIRNAAVLFASIIPPFILSLSFLVNEPLEREFSYSFFYDSTDKIVLMGDKPSNYSKHYHSAFANLNGQPYAETIEEMYDSVGLNLIEKAIIQDFISRYPFQWDVNTPKKFSSPSGERTERRTNNSPVQKVRINKVIAEFKHNPLINNGTVVGSEWAIPPKSRLAVMQKEKDPLQPSRKIAIKNPKMTLAIDIRPSGYGVLQKGYRDIAEPDPKNTYRYYDVNYRVKLSMKMNAFRLQRYSSERESYVRWFEDISSQLYAMDWENVETSWEDSQ